MISDGELFKLLINKYPKEPIHFIVERFMIFKFCLIQADKKMDSLSIEKATQQPIRLEDQAQKNKKYQYHLVMNPEKAINVDIVQCCLCGRKFQSLTANHLLSHGISVDEYKKLCGYAPTQKLICGNLLKKLRENAQKARRAREKKYRGNTRKQASWSPSSCLPHTVGSLYRVKGG
ncbi:MucR family transcriptional regulator [Bilophila wadsworthia]|uniref:MucR family transcriptional regulator n=1 Tax=Bilophila wadsworthia TaxID=35833 RepID=UPI001EDC3C19|nr:MucR family transcriptional regulator [Bilophila wadsworthia]MCG4633307.1 MucR family transcriptional regulator [Bilophila wadsworthia]